MSSTFADLGVPSHLCAILAGRGIMAPFPIQAATLPDALAGRDICGRAPTGSGKTLAFGLAIATLDPHAKPRRPRALVLVPTRELAAQVAGELSALMPSTGKGKRRQEHVIAVYGGASYGPQRRALGLGAAVVVACPGRLEDLLAQGDIDLRDVDLVVLDEADRMADMGFMPAVRRILDQTKSDRQTLLFSATLDGEIDEVVRRYQRKPARHEVVAEGDDGASIEHYFWRAEPNERTALAAALVNRHGRAIVFSRTRHGADRIARQLGQAGVEAVAIHGNRSQAQRERALSAFANGRASALVATDVAARGIHVDDVGCVVHFDLPADPKDYVHRSGRTGRAGASGTVISFVPKAQTKAARALQRAVGLPDQIDSPDVEASEMPVRRRTEARPSGERSGSSGGGERSERSERGEQQRRPQGGSGGNRGPRRKPRPDSNNGERNGNRRTRREGLQRDVTATGGSKSAARNSWRKRANAAKSKTR